MDYDTQDALDALGALDPGTRREDWVRIGMAAHAAGLRVEDFIEWSSRADNYEGERDCRQVWRSFKAGGIGPGTLFFLAEQSGWTPRPRERGVPHSAPRRHMTSPRDRDVEAEPRKPEAGAMERLAAILAASTAASPDHPYLERKDVFPDGLLAIPRAKLASILGYTPKVKRGELAGDMLLVAPLHAGNGVPASAELIDQDGRKWAVAGLPRKGLMWGELPREPASRIGIAEGVASAKTCGELMTIPVVAAGSSGNLAHVAAAIRAAQPEAEILLFADIGNGEASAEAAADAVYGICVKPAPIGDGTDFNDMARDLGRAETRAYLEKHAVNPRRVTWRQAMTRVQIDYVLPGLPAGSVGLIVGPGSVGKSFLTVEIAASIPLGRSLPRIPGAFNSLPVGRTAIVFGEDDPGIINNRMHSMLDAFMLTDKEIDTLDRDMAVLSFVGEDMRIVQVDQRNVIQGPFVPRLRQICTGRRLVFIDPLIRLHDGDENDNTAASHLMLEITRIARDTHCAIVLLHHVGKGDRDGWAAARGASAITTSARWQLNVFPPNAADIQTYGFDEQSVKKMIKCAGVKINYSEGIDHFWMRRNEHGVLLHTDPNTQPRTMGGSSGPDAFAGAPDYSNRSAHPGQRAPKGLDRPRPHVDDGFDPALPNGGYPPLE